MLSASLKLGHFFTLLGMLPDLCTIIILDEEVNREGRPIGRDRTPGWGGVEGGGRYEDRA